MEESRTKKSMKNVITIGISQIFGIVVSFVTRSFFIKYLGETYLGLNGFFTNILGMLSLAELGIGSAIAFSLYKPLAEGNTEVVKSIMRLYQKLYCIIGIVIFAAGLILLPFLKYLIGDDFYAISNVQWIFVIYLFNTTITYFYSYKRALIIADQKKYIDTIVRYVFILILNIAQIIILFLTNNFYLFLLCQMINNILENIVVTVIIDKKYPYLKGKADKLDKTTKKWIFSNTNALIYHKVGSVIIGSVDNILITFFVGLVMVGRYSNYILVSSGVNSILTQLFIAVTSSIGNLGATADAAKKEEVYKKILFINFVITNFCTICLYFLFNTFMTIWIGVDLLLPTIDVVLITLSFFLTCIRRPTLTFKDGFGIYRADRFKPLVEVLVNLVVSAILGYYIGLTGILIGTVVTYAFVSVWVEVKVLYRHGFEKSSKEYYKILLKFMLVFLASVAIVFAATFFIGQTSILHLVIRAIICLLVPNLMMILFYFKSKEFQYFFELVKKRFHRTKKTDENI